MDRAERTGFAVALVGHVVLFGALSLGLLTARIPKPPIADTMDVTFTDKAGLTSAAPKVATEAPAQSEAPDQGAPEESAPPPPAPEPEPTPAPPKPTPPKPRPTPPKPEKAEPEKPAPKPEPKPVPKPEPKPKAEKPKPAPPKPEKPKPEKAKAKAEKPTKAKPEKPTPDDSSSSPSKAKPTTAKHAAGLPSDFLSDLPGDKAGKGKAEKAKGSRIGKDFLKGLSADKTTGKSDAPRAHAVSPLAMNGIGALIKQQVQPNYNAPSGGANVATMKTTLNIEMARDGTVTSVQVVGHQGVNSSNSAYVQQVDEAAVRAIRRSSPLHLPADLYDTGWKNITLNFSPGDLQ